MQLLIRVKHPWVKKGSMIALFVCVRRPLCCAQVRRRRTTLLGGRCPDFRTIDLPGNHEMLFEAENATALRYAFLTATTA
ncbi:hypothetical protein QBC99_000085 [Beijerinckia sp. GAS462]|nr:hypothetical protein [Beijerinckia sp. GAS462]SEB51631.1 hypothetical protein SAMN05443249_0288 [Beijerinckia sp. 28-YEA-48]